MTEFKSNGLVDGGLIEIEVKAVRVNIDLAITLKIPRLCLV